MGCEWTHSNLTNDDIEKTITTLLQHDRITPQKATYTIKGTANENDIENISPKAMRTSAHRVAAWIKAITHPRGRLEKHVGRHHVLTSYQQEMHMPKPTPTRLRRKENDKRPGTHPQARKTTHRCRLPNE